MEIADRLKKMIREFGHTPASFADEIGVQRSSVSHVLNGRNKPGLDFIQKIAMHFPEMDVHWFITGEAKSRNKTEVSEHPRQKEGAGDYTADPPNITSKKQGAKLVRVMLFYEDGTVNEFIPSARLAE
jgi:transcriptional regulator with XRE-family HTH domain